MERPDFVDPVVLAKHLVALKVITQEEYEKIVKESTPDPYGPQSIGA